MDDRDDLSKAKIPAHGDGPQEHDEASLPAETASDGEEQAVAGAGPTEEAQATSEASLGSGAPVGPYTVVRVLHSEPGETVYLARHESTGDYFYDTGTPIFVTLIERPEGAFPGLERIAHLGLRHPRLLAPRDLVSQSGRSYLALDALTSPAGDPLPNVEGGARLDAHATLTTGAGLADALGYLHRSGVAHGHITPRTLYVREGRAYLGGMEEAIYDPVLAEDAPETQETIARDTNQLAAALGTLLAAQDAPSEAHAGEMQGLAAAVREIAAHGEAGDFATPNDLAGVCAIALQQIDRLLAALQLEAPQGRIQLAVGAASSVGRVRSENQDACASLILDVHDDMGDTSPVSLLLVADGMGGEARGELASRIAARIVAAEFARLYAVPYTAIPALLVTSDTGQEAIERPTAAGISQTLARSVALANAQIRELARQLGQTTGTTLTAIAIVGGHAALAHIGDSRGFLLRGGILHRLTEDHSVLARLQAIDHPLLSDPDVYVPRSMLYRSLGQEDDGQTDTLEFPVAPGDRLLLCSDGLWDEVDPALLERTFVASTDPTTCARELVALANESGGHDNSTAVVAFVHAMSDPVREGKEGRDGDGAAEQAVETADA